MRSWCLSFSSWLHNTLRKLPKLITCKLSRTAEPPAREHSKSRADWHSLSICNLTSSRSMTPEQRSSLLKEIDITRTQPSEASSHTHVPPLPTMVSTADGGCGWAAGASTTDAERAVTMRRTSPTAIAKVLRLERATCCTALQASDFSSRFILTSHSITTAAKGGNIPGASKSPLGSRCCLTYLQGAF